MREIFSPKPKPTNQTKSTTPQESCLIQWQVLTLIPTHTDAGPGNWWGMSLPVWVWLQSMSLGSPSPTRIGRSGRWRQWDAPWESEQRSKQCLYFQEGSKASGQYHPWSKSTAKLDTHKRMCRPLYITNNSERQSKYKWLYHSGGKWVYAN